MSLWSFNIPAKYSDIVAASVTSHRNSMFETAFGKFLSTPYHTVNRPMEYPGAATGITCLDSTTRLSKILNLNIAECNGTRPSLAFDAIRLPPRVTKQ